MTLHEILDRLLPCKHKWKVIDKNDVYPVNHLGKQLGTLPIHNSYILECTICGDVTNRKV